MATDTPEIADQTTLTTDRVDPATGRYDRSSLVGDFLVMIADQTPEAYLRQCP